MRYLLLLLIVLPFYAEAQRRCDTTLQQLFCNSRICRMDTAVLREYHSRLQSWMSPQDRYEQTKALQEFQRGCRWYSPDFERRRMEQAKKKHSSYIDTEGQNGIFSYDSCVITAQWNSDYAALNAVTAVYYFKDDVPTARAASVVEILLRACTAAKTDAVQKQGSTICFSGLQLPYNTMLRMVTDLHNHKIWLVLNRNGRIWVE
ncbi:hypothetical protein ACTHGU_02395 [Chitinophagaceae bacterium MMS25-I14]